MLYSKNKYFFNSENVIKSIQYREETILLKKAEELFIPCDFEVPWLFLAQGKSKFISSKSIILTKNVFMRCVSFTEVERHKKLTKHETYHLEKLNKKLRRKS